MYQDFIGFQAVTQPNAVHEEIGSDLNFHPTQPTLWKDWIAFESRLTVDS